MKLLSFNAYPQDRVPSVHRGAGDGHASHQDVGRGVSESAAAALIAGYSGRLADRLQMQWEKEHGVETSPIEHARQIVQSSHGTLHREANDALRRAYHRDIADRILVELLKEKGSGWAIGAHPSGRTSGTSDRVALRGDNMGGPHVGEFLPSHGTTWAPWVAGAGVTDIVLGAHYGEDTLSYMKHISNAVDAFWEDVVRDVCIYGSVKTSDAAKSDSNPYGIVAAEKDGYPAWDSSVCKKRGFPLPPLAGNAPHVKSDWLTAFNYWVQDWGSYLSNGGKGWVDIVGLRPDRAQLDTWYGQLESPGGWRQQAIKSGVVTITPIADSPVKPKEIPWTTILIVGGILAAAILLGQVRSFIPTRIIPST